MATVKLKGSETNLATDTNVNFATLVRVVNNKTSIQLITHKAAGSVELVEKTATDTLLGAATSLAVKVAYTK